eukprot:jgi/Mesen1/7728/ME000407S06958
MPVSIRGASSSSTSVENSTETEFAQNEKNLVFTTFGCPFCRRAKNTLKEQNVSFKEVNVDKSPQLREALASTTGRRTVPVIYLNGQLIGGSDELEEIVTEKKLASILDGSSSDVPDALKDLLDSSAGEKSPSAPDLSNKAQVRRLKLEQIAARMADPGKGVLKQTLQTGWKSEKVFSGEAAVRWILQTMPDVLDSSDALDLGRELQEAQLLHHVSFSAPFSNSGESFFRLHSDEPPLSGALNGKQVWLKPARPASEVSEGLRAKVLELYEEALSSDGRSVNYASLATSQTFRSYVTATEELQRVDLFSMSREEKLAFWINIYNALVIHAMVQNGPPSSTFDRLFFYKSNKYHIGGYEFSLDDMEHGVLRGNQAPSLSFLGRRAFSSTDPRRFQALPPVDPRIHFALNCGAKSCPPIKVYTAETLEAGLDGAAAAFCESEVVVNVQENVVTLSKILDWYKADFGSTTEQRLRWLLPHLEDGKKRDLESLLKKGTPLVEYSTYNWDIND